MRSYELAVDLGADSIRVALSGASVPAVEPSIVAQPLGSESILCGAEAARAFAAHRQNYRFIRPVAGGVIADERNAVRLVNAVCRRYLSQASREPEIMATVALMNGIDHDEVARYERVFAEAGIQPIRFAESGLAAFGAISEQFGVQSGMVVDIGRDKTEITAVHDGAAVDGCSLFVGGKHIDSAVREVVFGNFGISVTTEQAEDIKKRCVSLDKKDASSIIISGVSAKKNEPVSTRVSARDFFEGVCSVTELIVLAVNSLFNSLKGEAFGQIRNSGVFLTGGCANIYGIGEFFCDCLNVPSRVADKPESAVIRGLTRTKGGRF